MKVIFFLILYLVFSINYSFAKEYVYIFNSPEINKIYNNAVEYFKSTQIFVDKEVRGVVLMFTIEDFEINSFNISDEILKKIEKIEYFLAKIKNPVIIEVHTAKIPIGELVNLKNWEISTIVANKIESILLQRGQISQERIKSVGYGEFMPLKNTPNNGVKKSGRVDIIILCSINGE